MKRTGLTVAMTVLVLGLLARPAGTASQNGDTPPKPSGLAGQLLVAAEEMGDPRFVQTVILMVRHDATGAMGLTDYAQSQLSDIVFLEILSQLHFDHFQGYHTGILEPVPHPAANERTLSLI